MSPAIAPRLSAVRLLYPYLKKRARLPLVRRPGPVSYERRANR